MLILLLAAGPIYNFSRKIRLYTDKEKKNKLKARTKKGQFHMLQCLNYCHRSLQNTGDYWHRLLTEISSSRKAAETVAVSNSSESRLSLSKT